MHGVALAVAAVSLVAELLVVVCGVLSRVLLARSFLWTDEVSQLALSTIAFVGGAAAFRDGHHTAIRLVSDRLPPAARRLLAALLDWTVLLSALCAGAASLDLLRSRYEDVTPILQVSAAWISVPFTAGMALVALYAGERLLLRHGRAAVLAAGAVALPVLAWAMLWGQVDWLANNGPAGLGAMLVLFFAAVLLGLPVAFSMLLATLLYLDVTGTAPAVAVPQNMVDGTGNFVLLALPFFILAGGVMERGGISLRLIRFAMALVGRMRGGLLQVIVVTIYMVSGISGSKVADVAAVGSVMRGELSRRGVRAAEGAAVLAASAAMAETIPPSIVMLVLGSVTPISIGTLFVAGLLPAAVIAACLMALIALLARRRGFAAVQAPDVSRGRAAAGAVLPLVMPLAMVIGIRFGIATPTEVSSFAVLYGIALSAVVYRELTPRGLFRLTASCASTAGMVLFVIAAASSFAWVLAAADLPHALVSLLAAAGGNRWTFMVGSIVLLVVIGSLLEGLPAIIILAPLLLPIAVGYGFDAVQYGIVLILAMGIGAFMPPIGIGFYVASAVVGSSVEAAASAMLPFLIVLLLSVLLIAFVPAITLILPRLLG